jgi:hypothetical protein
MLKLRFDIGAVGRFERERALPLEARFDTAAETPVNVT